MHPIFPGGYTVFGGVCEGLRSKDITNIASAAVQQDALS